MTHVGVSPRHAAALLYAAMGWYVLPLHTPNADGVCDCRRPDAGDAEKHPIGKHPRTRSGLDDASNDQDVVDRWWRMWPHANVGIDLARSGLVDVAPDSIEWFAEFTARGLDPTLRFASGGGEGHAHHLYLRPEGCAVHRDTHSGEYDVLSAGYAVMPPSLHRSQRTYTWMDGVESVIAPPTRSAPQWVVDLLNARGKRSYQTSTPPPVDDDDAPPVELRGEALERWYGRVCQYRPGGEVDRSYSLWWIAVVLLKAGLRRGLVEQCLAERDVALGWTKFTGRRDAAARYRIIVERAVAGQGPGDARVRAEPRAKATSDYVWLTSAELEVLEEEETEWFLTKYLARGVITELDGKVKQAGKTTFIGAMLRAVLDGEEFLGETTTYTPITYLSEQTTKTFRIHLRRAGLLGRPDFHILLWANTQGDAWPEVVRNTYAHMQQAGSLLLVVDTLGQFSGVRGDEENKAGSAMKVMEPLQELAAQGIGILISRHDRKSGGEVGDSGRGSSAYTGVGDIILHLQRPFSDDPSKKRRRELKTLSRLDEIGDLVIELEPLEPSTYRLIGEEEQVRARDMRIEVLAALPTDPEAAIDRDTLFALVRGRALDITRALKTLLAEDVIVRLGKGGRADKFRYYQRVWDADD